MDLKLPLSHNLFNGDARTIVFNKLKQEENGDINYYILKENEDILKQVSEVLHNLKIQSIIVEGGTKLLQGFIDSGMWDEARIINNKELEIGNGIHAPVLKNEMLVKSHQIMSDTIKYFHNKNTIS